MKKLTSFLLICFVVYALFQCTKVETPPTQNEATQQQYKQEIATEDQSETSESSLKINPNRAYYDVVVVDIDRWEICLNVVRVRRNVISYSGHLWYQSGRYIFEGSATATYNPHWDALTVIALDSGWDRGHIMYNLQFEDATGTDMHGTFVYYEYPLRTNWVDAWLAQGKLGEHDAGPYIGNSQAKEVLVPFLEESAIHPKKARFEAEKDFE